MSSFTLASYNVKDLFLPAPGETQERWEAKLRHLAQRIERSGAEVVCLQEVGGPAALEALLAVLGARWQGYCAPPDPRGIACALISTLPFGDAQGHRQEDLPFPRFVAVDPAPFAGRLAVRRAVASARFATAIGEVMVFSLHLKSNLPLAEVDVTGRPQLAMEGRARAEGFVRSLVVRAAEALYVRGLVDQALLGCDKVIVAGDCNDGPSSVPVRILQGDVGEPSGAELLSINPKIAEHKRYTALFRGKPQQLDHVLISTGLQPLLQRADVDLEGLRDHGPFDPNAPPTIDSDHAPILASFATAV